MNILRKAQRAFERVERIVRPPSDSLTANHHEAGRWFDHRRDIVEHLVRAIAPRVPPDGLFIDVGANVRYLSLMVMESIGFRGEAHLLEPVPDLAVLCCHTFSARPYRVTVHELALSDTVSTIPLFVAGDGNIGWNTMTAGKAHPNVRRIEVPTAPFDSLGLSNPGFIKTNVEGAEHFVLRGMLESLRAARPRPAILCEIGWANSTPTGVRNCAPSKPWSRSATRSAISPGNRSISPTSPRRPTCFFSGPDSWIVYRRYLPSRGLVPKSWHRFGGCTDRTARLHYENIGGTANEPIPINPAGIALAGRAALPRDHGGIACDPEVHNIHPAGVWPPDGLEAAPSCPACGSVRRRLLHDGLTDIAFGCAPGTWAMFQCADCDAAYLDPRPTATSLALAYRNYYTHDNHGDHGAGLAKRLRRGYINARYGFRAEPASRLGAFVLPLFPRLRASWDKNCRHLPRLPHRGARLLDLGSGDGSFLALAATAGWAVEGIDTDPEAVRIAASRGITVTEGSAQHLHFADARFDVVTLNHVIEHSHDPSAVLRECWRVLRPGGVLWIATPNCASWCHRWFGAAWRGLEPPRHLVLFTRGALERLLRDARFYDLRFRWAGIQARFYGETSRAIGLGSGSGVGHPPFYESLLWLVFDWTSRFALTRAEELVVQARKPACA